MPRGLCRASGAKGRRSFCIPFTAAFPQKIPFLEKIHKNIYVYSVKLRIALPPRVVKYGYSLKLYLTVLKN